jgi:hypothetical protein
MIARGVFQAERPWALKQALLDHKKSIVRAIL